MSSLGYVILFMACSVETVDCTPTSIQLTRFDGIEQCRAALPAAQSRLDRIGRSQSVVPVCSALDELCKPTAVGLRRPYRLPTPAPQLSRLTDGQAQLSRQPSIAAHLSIMCRLDRHAPVGCEG